jgi:hypothetical protein
MSTTDAVLKEYRVRCDCDVKFFESCCDAEYQQMAAMADEIVRLREALAAACVQGTPMGEAHATRVTVVDEWRVLDKNGDECFMGWNVQDAERQRMWCEEAAPEDAPHRVVRVALVDQNHPEMPESSTRVTEAMKDAAFNGFVDAHFTFKLFELTPADEAKIRASVAAALTAALDGPRDQ